MPRVFPQPTDAPPATQVTLRDVMSRITDLETRRSSDATAQTATDKGQAATLQNLSGQVSNLSSVVTTLQTQFLYAQNLTPFIQSNQNGFAYYAYDGTYDSSITFVSPPSGNIWITVGGYLTVTNTGGPFVTFEVYQDSTQLRAPNIDNAAQYYFSTGTSISGTTAQNSTLITVPGDTVTTVRTIRGRNNNNPHSGSFGIQRQTLTITKVF
jgi:hypothetical protein